MPDCKNCKVRNSRRLKIGERTVRLDKCLVNIVDYINRETENETLGSCCGHGRYTMSIVVRDKNGEISDLISGKEIPRTRNFYRTDENGYYYLPETLK